MSSIDHIIASLIEKKIMVSKVLSRNDLLKRLTESIEAKIMKYE
jgi:hypothetical protein